MISFHVDVSRYVSNTLRMCIENTVPSDEGGEGGEREGEDEEHCEIMQTLLIAVLSFKTHHTSSNTREASHVHDTVNCIVLSYSSTNNPLKQASFFITIRKKKNFNCASK